ncbi:MAG: hypothetical protein HY735_02825 [Verrucomicrobia bacterium]|nr:hypothetical protein [Verrucomicrobiota bacterium]
MKANQLGRNPNEARSSFFVVIVGALMLFDQIIVRAQTTVTVEVRATADIALAGQSAGAKLGSDTVPANSPTNALLPLTAGQAVQVSATGSVISGTVGHRRDPTQRCQLQRHD